ncbi:MAG: hypothetical protein HY784_06375 [Chloroflexi bacterium]|nr:hypothetical protein [Chloroflexota bacterium]
MPPLLPILILCFGVLSLALGLRRSFRAAGLLAAVSAALALLTWLAGGAGLPRESTLSAWQRSAFFGLSLTLRADPVAWLFSGAILTLTLSILLTGFAREGGRRLAARGALLMLAATGLAAVLAENLITLAVAWAALDLIYFLALASQAQEEREIARSVVNLGFNAAGTLLVAAAALLAARRGQLPLFEPGLPAGATGLLCLAAGFRLGLFPFPAGVALHLLARATALGIPARFAPWLSGAGLLATLAGGLQWWAAPAGEKGAGVESAAHSSFVLCLGGLALLAGTSGDAALGLPGVAALGISMMLAGGSLFLYEGRPPGAPYQIAWPLAALAALIGLPLTLGYVSAGALFGGQAAAGHWGRILAAMLALALLLAGGLRRALRPRPLDESRDPLLRLAYQAGLALPLLFALLAGLSPSGFAGFLRTPAPAGGAEGVWALAGAALAALGGVALWGLGAGMHSRAGRPWAWLAHWSRLEWLYAWLWGAYRLLARALRELAGIVEGESALLWSLAAAVLAWLLIAGH